MIASVLRALSRMRTPASVRSGTMSANSLVCFTCPAITACDTPDAFKRLMHLPSCPSETQCSAAAGARAARSARSGKASSFIAMTVTSWPAARAASSTKNGNRPLPAIRPRRIVFQPRNRDGWDDPRRGLPAVDEGGSFVGKDFFRLPRRPSQNDAALRCADELDQILHLGARQRSVLLNLLERARRVQLRLKQVPERALQLLYDVG